MVRADNFRSRVAVPIGGKRLPCFLRPSWLRPRCARARKVRTDLHRWVRNYDHVNGQLRGRYDLTRRLTVITRGGTIFTRANQEEAFVRRIVVGTKPI